jgi:hypothetical protein
MKLNYSEKKSLKEPAFPKNEGNVRIQSSER